MSEPRLGRALPGASFALGGAVDTLVIITASASSFLTEDGTTVIFAGQILLLLCVLSAVFVAGVVCGFVVQDRMGMPAIAFAILALFVAAGLASADLTAAAIGALTIGAGTLHAWLAGYRRHFAAGAPARRSEQEIGPGMFVFLWLAVGGGIFGALMGFLVLGMSSLWLAAGAATLVGLAAGSTAASASDGQ